MTTLAQARKALNTAQALNTAEAWQAAALAFSAASEAKTARKLADPTQVKHTGKTPIMHVGRCTLADGYTVRVSIGQFKGETVADSLARLERFTIASEGSEWLRMKHPRHCFDLAGQSALAARDYPYGVAECRIVKYGSGPDAGIDLETPPMLAAAE